jgi:hypothetical protein
MIRKSVQRFSEKDHAQTKALSAMIEIIALKGVTMGTACAKEAPMINFATSYFWYFGYDSSLAVGGSRSI